MGRCVACRNQTQNFCHVHQEFVCVDCLVDAPGHARCHVGAYRDWVNDSSYPWPPKCVICSEELVSDDGVSRLFCLAIVEDSCLANKPPEDGQCPHCETSMIPSSTDKNSIASHLRSKLKDLPWVKKIAPNIGQPPPERGEPIGTTTNAKGDVTIDFGISGIQERAHGDKVSAQRRGDVPEIDVDDKQQKAQQEKARRLLMSSMRFFRTHRRQIFLISILLLLVTISVLIVKTTIQTSTAAQAQRREDILRFRDEASGRRNPRF
ncbi:hypothetical protein NDN08_003312 [Rhodosorus marinus]|uniref:ZFPL1-like B-box zinc-binding domain-containing protein n=1 Tax=Rhodosorus marinus TaxID=101924 RepID=A0AAV8UYY9_9RHOD|nr:hypothetical protein NDN08_003312 [Rhodosorus marinus]